MNMHRHRDLHHLDALPLFNAKTTEKKMNDQPQPPLGGLVPAQHDMLGRILKALENMGVSYAITLPDGSEKKTGTYAAPPKRGFKSPLYGRGVMQHYFEPFLREVGTGQLVVIPRGDFAVESLRGAICGYCTSRWGRSTYTTAISTDRLAVEVLRHDGI